MFFSKFLHFTGLHTYPGCDSPACTAPAALGCGAAVVTSSELALGGRVEVTAAGQEGKMRVGHQMPGARSAKARGGGLRGGDRDGEEAIWTSRWIEEVGLLPAWEFARQHNSQ